MYGYVELDDVVHEMLDGRWIVAHWDERSNQWRSSNIRQKPFDSYTFTTSNTLEGLARMGIRTYQSRSGAVNAARKHYCFIKD